MFKYLFFFLSLFLFLLPFSLHNRSSVNVSLLCSCRAGRTSSPRRRRSAVLVLPADCVSPTASPTVTSRSSRQTKHSSLTLSSAAPTATAGESVAVVKPASQQRYSLSAIVIPRLSISDDADSGDNVPGDDLLNFNLVDGHETTR